MTTQDTKPKRRLLGLGFWGPTLIIGAMGACGGRIGRPVEMPVGATVVMPATSEDLVSNVRKEYPHVALSVLVGGKQISLAEDFELQLARDQEGADIVASYKSVELASSSRDTRCPAQLQATQTADTALFCNGRLKTEGASFFTLIRANGQRLHGTSLLTDSLDPDAGIRTLSVRF